MKLIPIFLPEKSCPFDCAFCSVAVANGPEAEITDQDMVARRIQESIQTLTLYHEDEQVEIAFYGGTFTAGRQEQMTQYLEKAAAFVGTNGIQGIRISTRPDCINREILTLLKQYSVTTVELGVESFDNAVLKNLGRLHDAACSKSAIRLLKQAGFTTGIHLMTGCPGESRQSFSETIRTTIELKPHTVRIHPLLVLRGTRLAGEGYEAPGCEDLLDQLSEAVFRLESADIPVIRLGLQATDSLNETGAILSGCYHPALRHRVMSRIYGRFLERFPSGDSLLVQAGTLHYAYVIGFQRENAKAFPYCSIKADNVLKAWEVRVNGKCYHVLAEGLYETD